MHFITNKFHLYHSDYIFAGIIVQQMEMCHTTKKAQSTKRRIQKCANQENRERPEQRRTGPDRNHGRDPGPKPNRPREGGGQGDPPRVRAHP